MVWRDLVLKPGLPDYWRNSVIMCKERINIKYKELIETVTLRMNLICLHTVKWFYVLLSNSSNLIQYQSNGYTYMICKWMEEFSLGILRGCPRGVMVKALDCGIVVREFVLQSRYYVHFRANTLGKGIKTPYPPRYG